jgi:hypothetical protein
MNQQDANRMLGAGLVMAVVSATLAMLDQEFGGL